MPVPVMPSPPPAPKGPRTEPHTRDSEVDRAIAALVAAGHWERVRAAALWQPPQYLSEDEQLAVVLEELADPDHPHHDAIGCIAVVLGDEGVLRAREAAVRQGRLTRSAWEFWTGRAGRDARGEDTSRLRFRVR